MLRLIPGDAVAIVLGANIDIIPEPVDALRRQLGLHLPLCQQYAQGSAACCRATSGAACGRVDPSPTRSSGAYR